MKSNNIEWIHAKLEKQIKLVGAYTENSVLIDLIKMCRLKPYDFLQKKKMKVILYPHWVDEFGNSLIIKKTKKIRIILNDLSLDKTKIVSTDLYYGLSLDKIFKISKSMMLCFGNDVEINSRYYLLSFLGLDNYLRSYLYEDGSDSWQAVSPLLLDTKILQNFAKQSTSKYFKELKTHGLPCQTGTAWLSFLPLTLDFIHKIEKQDAFLANVLNSIGNKS